jgi:hypothetical protein
LLQASGVSLLTLDAPPLTILIAGLADDELAIGDLFSDQRKSLRTLALAFALSEAVHAVKNAPPLRCCV